LNRFIAEVKKIVPLKRLNLIKFDLNGQEINVLILEMNIDINVGKKAELIIKPTAISILNEKCDFENVLKGKIKKITHGDILSSVVVDVGGIEMESITLREKADLKDDVFVVFKSNDIAVSKVFND